MQPLQRRQTFGQHLGSSQEQVTQVRQRGQRLQRLDAHLLVHAPLDAKGGQSRELGYRADVGDASKAFEVEHVERGRQVGGPVQILDLGAAMQDQTPQPAKAAETAERTGAHAVDVEHFEIGQLAYLVEHVLVDLVGPQDRNSAARNA